MRLTIGISSTRLLKQAKELGATEIYCGYLEIEATKKWPDAFNTLNRRGEKASIFGLKQFAKFAKEAERLNLPGYVTFNGLYTPEQHKWVLSAINKVSKFNIVQGIIVNDMALLLKLTKYKKEKLISTGGTAFNSETVNFYKSLGATRIILDRQLTNKEILDIVNSGTNELEFEVFLLFGKSPCFFIDGFCSFFHSFESSAAQKKKYFNTLFQGRRHSGCAFISKSKVNEAFAKHTHTGCNICIVKMLSGRDNVVFKVGGRQEKKFSKEFLETVSFFVKSQRLKSFLSAKQWDAHYKSAFKQMYGYGCNSSRCYIAD